MIDLGIMAVVFAASFLFGTILLKRVPPLLHTPLMSMTNAVSGVTVLGALVLFKTGMDTVWIVLAVSAIVTAMFNVFGGFVITDRMLRMFRKKNAVSGPHEEVQ